MPTTTPPINNATNILPVAFERMVPIKTHWFTICGFLFVVPMPGTVLVVNPRSAGGRTEKDWPRLREVIHEAFGPFEHQFTTEAGHATTLAREALRGGADLVVAMGGDGTIDEVANGFFDGDDKVAPGAALGVLRGHRR